MKIQIKNRWTGDVLFSHECEGNTIKKTLEKAVEKGANLYKADLPNANLSKADLSNANLYNADLSNANLYNADLSNADLSNADLSKANLYNADLSNADLSNADLSNANLYNADLSNADLSNANLYNADLKRTGIVSFSNFGSSERTTYFRLSDSMVKCGCFWGTLEEFEAQVKQTHKEGSIHRVEYLAMIEMIKKVLEIRKK